MAGTATVGWFLHEYSVIVAMALLVILAGVGCWFWPDEWGGDGELPRAVAAQATSVWWECLRGCGNGIIRC